MRTLGYYVCGSGVLHFYGVIGVLQRLSNEAEFDISFLTSCAKRQPGVRLIFLRIILATVPEKAAHIPETAT